MLLSVRFQRLLDFLTWNRFILLPIVLPLAFCLVYVIIGEPFDLASSVAGGSVPSLYYMGREIRLLKTMKSDLDPEFYSNFMRRSVMQFSILALVFALSILTMLGYTHDKSGVGLIFMLVVGLFL